jgi:hypothetical protein
MAEQQTGRVAARVRVIAISTALSMSARSLALVCATAFAVAALVMPAATSARATPHTTRCPVYRTNVQGDPWTFTDVTARDMTCRTADGLLRRVATTGFVSGFVCRGAAKAVQTCIGPRSRRLTYKSVPND